MLQIILEFGESQSEKEIGNFYIALTIFSNLYFLKLMLNFSGSKTHTHTTDVYFPDPIYKES